MNDTFPKFLLLSLLALVVLLETLNSTTLGQQPAPDSGQQLVMAAARRMGTYETMEAKIRIRTDLLGQPLVGTGKYAQLAATSGLMLRLELAIQAGSQTTSVKQISDGRNLWEHWRIGESERVNHIDLTRVARSMKQHPGTISMSTSSLASGGLPKLLNQLTANFDFDGQAVRSGTLGGIEVLGVTGVWKADKLAASAPEAVDQDRIVFERLPMHLPHQVELILGKNDQFPYRVSYHKWEGDEPAQLTPVVTTEFFEVAVGNPLDASQFHYERPPQLQMAEQTDVYLKSMGIATRPGTAASR